jgi:hypothetical protein
VFERFDYNEKLIVAVNLSQKEITLKFSENMIEYGKDRESNISNIEKENYIILTKKTTDI